MSAHSRSDWQFGEPISDELVADVVRCVQINHELWWGCFAILSPADALVHWLGQAVRTWDGQTDLGEHVRPRLVAEDVWFVEFARRAEPLLKAG